MLKSPFLKLLLPWLLPLPLNAAAVYYASPTGNDGNPGTLDAPFATLQAAVTHLAPGDTLQVREGTYYGPVSVAVSGTAAAPVTLEAYPGECPLLDGAAPVTGSWTPYQGSIYQAPWPTQPVQVFCDGRLLNEARWPAAGVEGLSSQPVAHTDSGSATQVVCSALPNLDLTGALLQIMAGQSWCAYTRTIVSEDRASGTLAFNAPVSEFPQLVPRRGDRFYVFGKLNLLTSAGEWFWDAGTQRLYVWAPDGASPDGRVEAGPASCLLSLDNRSFVTVKGLTARGGWFSLHNSIDCTIGDCHLVAPNWNRTVNGYATQPQYLGGIDITGTGDQVLGGSVVFAGRSGVNIAGGSSHRVRGLTVEDCGWNWANDGGINTVNSSQCLVEGCTVSRVARMGIWDYGSGDCRFLDNLLTDTALYSSDTGAFDSWGTDGQGTEVAYNLCRGNHAVWGAGIYLDEGAKDFYVHDNVVEDVGWHGINFRESGVRVENNTVLGAGHEAVDCSPNAGQTLAASDVEHNQLAENFPVRVSLQTPDVTDYGYYGGYAYLAAPGRVELDWNQLDQPWWALQIPMDLSRVSGVAFSVECPAGFDYTVADLRLLPQGQTGDAGAVTLSGSWYASGGGGSTCAMGASGPATWGAIGNNVNVGGWNTLGVNFSGAMDFTAYRGLAFEVGGTASRAYTWAGCTDLDNGPQAAPGRGASLPASVGAPDSAAATQCQAGAFSPTPTPSPTPIATATVTGAAGPPVLYPNPVTLSGPLTIRLNLDSTADVDVRIFTTAFRKVLEKDFHQVPPHADLPLAVDDGTGEPLANGLYYVLVATSRDRNIQKLLVLR